MPNATARLRTCRGRLARANEKLDRLEADVRPWASREPKPYEIAVEINPQTFQKVYRYRVVREPPEGWPLDLSEIANHWRATLNGLIGAAATKPAKSFGFPIYRFEPDYLNPRGKARISARDEYLANVPDTLRAVVDDVQPYHRGNDRDAHPLAVLSWLADSDRHADAHMVGIFRGIEGLLITPENPESDWELEALAPGSRLDDGAEFLRILMAPDPHAKVRVQGPIATEIAFGDRGLTFPGLRTVEAYVVEIVERFEAALAPGHESAS